MQRALDRVTAATDLFPHYKRAMWRRGVLLTENERYEQAQAQFEKLHELDKSWPGLLDWLKRVHQRRRDASGETALYTYLKVDL